MWPTVHLEPQQLTRICPTLASNMTTWLRQRSPGLHKLTLQCVPTLQHGLATYLCPGWHRCKLATRMLLDAPGEIVDAYVCKLTPSFRSPTTCPMLQRNEGVSYVQRATCPYASVHVST
jgi:hypothetical protein